MTSTNTWRQCRINIQDTDLVTATQPSCIATKRIHYRIWWLTGTFIYGLLGHNLVLVSVYVSKHCIICTLHLFFSIRVEKLTQLPREMVEGAESLQVSGNQRSDGYSFRNPRITIENNTSFKIVSFRKCVCVTLKSRHFKLKFYQETLILWFFLSERSIWKICYPRVQCRWERAVDHSLTGSKLQCVRQLLWNVYVEGW